RKAIGDDEGAGRDDALGQRLDALSLEASDATHLEACRSLTVRRLKRHDDCPLARAAAARLAAGALATEIGVVHLDAALERGPVIVEAHNLCELGLDLPCGRLRGAETATELDRGDALLSLRDQVHGTEPHCQGQLGGMKNGAGDLRCLFAAGVALEQLARRAVATAMRLDEATRGLHRRRSPLRRCRERALRDLGHE